MSSLDDLHVLFLRTGVQVTSVLPLSRINLEEQEQKGTARIDKSLQLRVYSMVYKICRQGPHSEIERCWTKLAKWYVDFCRVLKDELVAGSEGQVSEKGVRLDPRKVYLTVQRLKLMGTIVSSQFRPLMDFTLDFEKQKSILSLLVEDGEEEECLQEAPVGETKALTEHDDEDLFPRETSPVREFLLKLEIFVFRALNLEQLRVLDVAAILDSTMLRDGGQRREEVNMLTPSVLGVGSIRQSLEADGSRKALDAIDKLVDSWSTSLMARLPSICSVWLVSKEENNAFETMKAISSLLSSIVKISDFILGPYRSPVALIGPRLTTLRLCLPHVFPFVEQSLNDVEDGDSNVMEEKSVGILSRIFELFEEDSKSIEGLSRHLGDVMRDELNRHSFFNIEQTRDEDGFLRSKSVEGSGKEPENDVEQLKLLINIYQRFYLRIGRAHPQGAISVFQTINHQLSDFIEPAEMRVSAALAANLHQALGKKSIEEKQGESSEEVSGILRVASLIRDKELFARFCCSYTSSRLLNYSSDFHTSQDLVTDTQWNRELAVLQKIVHSVGRAAAAPICSLCQTFSSSSITELCPLDGQQSIIPKTLFGSLSKVLPAAIWTSHISRPQFQLDNGGSDPLQQMKATAIPLLLQKSLLPSISHFEALYGKKYATRHLVWPLHVGSLLLECVDSKHPLFGLQVVCPPIGLSVFEGMKQQHDPMNFNFDEVLGEVLRSSDLLDAEALRSSLENIVRSLVKSGVLVRTKQSTNRYELASVRPSKSNGAKLKIVKASSGFGLNSRSGPRELERIRNNSVGRHLTQEQEKILEASLMRALKKFKTLTVGELYSVTLREVKDRFAPIKSHILKILSSLENREFVRREELPQSGTDANGTYHYVA